MIPIRLFLKTTVEDIKHLPFSVNLQIAAALFNNPSFGRNTLTRQLRNHGIFMPGTTMPYRRFLSSGYFEVRLVTKGTKAFPQTYITLKGLAWLVRLANTNKWFSKPVTIPVTSITAVTSGVVRSELRRDIFSHIKRGIR